MFIKFSFIPILLSSIHLKITISNKEIHSNAILLLKRLEGSNIKLLVTSYSLRIHIIYLLE